MTYKPFIQKQSYYFYFLNAEKSTDEKKNAYKYIEL